ncbi:TetR/AcrR family transcriptional regulator [Motilibacter rhizosphaerae]|uniref:TetR/AcrR family transcriptional regulator n=1 Tax=Motilibacter rhizosphaerae TaxID=598652 RepID=UPI001E5A33B9|nr:TetR/AcrR family transcriptional regulator C-terminal domain-containing protein [Motilibacter rhizosphaerae]
MRETVALLDEAGEPSLTFRALAARLGGGVGSIYWYVSSKDELLDRATDAVLAEVVAQTEQYAGRADDPVEDVRAIAVALFEAVVARHWLGAYLMRDTTLQPHALQLFERIGEQVMRLGLGPRDCFHAVSAVIGFVVGTAADLGQQAPQEVLDGRVTAEEYMTRFADQWRSLDPEAFPFVHFIVEEFAGHDDTEQFQAGLDLLLEGLRARAAGA